MFHVAPGSRSPFWSQNQVKVLINRESSFYISSTKNPSQIIFLKFDSVFCSASACGYVTPSIGFDFPSLDFFSDRLL